MSTLYRDTIPYILFLACFIPTLLGYYFDVPIFTKVSLELSTWSSLAMSTALFLGLANLFIYNIRTVRERKRGEWQFGIYTVTLTVLWIIIGLYYGGLASKDYQQAYIYVKAQCWAAQIGLLAFFFTSAAYRTLKAYRPQGILMLIFFLSALVSISPWGEMLWPGLPSLGAWILDNIAMSASRAIVIAASMGLVAMITRILLKYEKGGLAR